MLARRAVEAVPQRGPHKTQRPRHHERRLPAVAQRQEHHQRRRQQGPQRRARIEVAHRDGFLLVRKPLRHRLHARRDGRGLGQPHQPPEARQRQPARRARMQATGNRPQHREQRKADAQADQVDDEPAHRLHDRVADLERADHVGILLCAHAQLGLELRRQHAERIARQVVRNGAQAHQCDDPPAQALDGLHALSPDVFFMG